MQTLRFDSVTTEQTATTLSHIRAIASINNMTVNAFVCGTGHDRGGEAVFLTHFHKVLNIPIRKYFVLEVDSENVDVRFDDTFTLLIDLS